MKDFVTAQPHLVETDLGTHGDTPFIILACDGIRNARKERHILNRTTNV